MSAARSPVSGLVFPFLLTTGFVTCFVSATLNNIESNRSPHLEQFQYCVQKSQKPRLRECVGRMAINFLQRFDEEENYTLAHNLISSKNEAISGRSLVNLLDTDPVDFRGILENAGAVFSQRNFEWHMDGVYPGLMLKIGPTADTNSVAEFVIDPNSSERQLIYQEPSTARIVAKQYLLPFLLGLKFNLVALVPLLFAGIVLLLKKSLFLAKLAIFVSSFLGIGGAAGLLGGLGGIGASLGPSSIFGFGLGPNPIRGHGANFDVASTSGQTGYFPGKTAVFNQHFENSDDLQFHQATPYKRSERKVNFEKPGEFVGSRTVTPTTPAIADRFYDYEHIRKIQDRNGKPHNSHGMLGPSAVDEEGGIVEAIFRPSEQSGWKVIDVRA